MSNIEFSMSNVKVKRKKVDGGRKMSNIEFSMSNVKVNKETTEDR